MSKFESDSIRVREYLTSQWSVDLTSENLVSVTPSMLGNAVEAVLFSYVIDASNSQVDTRAVALIDPFSRMEKVTKKLEILAPLIAGKKGSLPDSTTDYYQRRRFGRDYIQDSNNTNDSGIRSKRRVNVSKVHRKLSSLMNLDERKQNMISLAADTATARIDTTFLCADGKSRSISIIYDHLMVPSVHGGCPRNGGPMVVLLHKEDYCYFIEKGNFQEYLESRYNIVKTFMDDVVEEHTDEEETLDLVLYNLLCKDDKDRCDSYYEDFMTLPSGRSVVSSINFGQIQWQSARKTIKGRQMNSVYLPSKVKEGLFDYLDDFYSDESSTFFKKMNIPRKCILLFYGVPGTGKTSLARAIGDQYNLNIAKLSLSDRKMTDNALSDAFSAIPKDSMLVLDDVDSLFDENRKGEAGNTLSFSALLNCLDGISDLPDDQLIVLTTNHYDRLDPALKRCGRVDYSIGFGFMTTEQIRMMTHSFYAHATEPEINLFTKVFDQNNPETTPSFLQQLFIRYRKLTISELTTKLQENDMDLNVQTDVNQLAPTSIAKATAKDNKEGDTTSMSTIDGEGEQKVDGGTVDGEGEEKSEGSLHVLSESVVKTLKNLKRAEIGELKGFKIPPPIVQFVLEGVCVLLGEDHTWENAKKLLGRSDFIDHLNGLNKDNIPAARLEKLRTDYINHPNFDPDAVARASRAAHSLCLWARAMDAYVSASSAT